MAEYKVGQTIETANGLKGIIRFVGSIHVSEGQFLGIELPNAQGKNDGSVQGERYFDCPSGHGLFVRPAAVARIVSQPAPTPSRPTPKPAASRLSMAPPSRPSMSGSPTRNARPRPSSIAGSSAAKPTPALKPTAPKPAAAKSPTPKPSAASSRMSISSSPAQTGQRMAPRKSSISTTSTSRTTTTKPTAPASRSSTVTKASAQSSADDTKVRVLEKQLAESREKTKELDQVKTERDKYATIIQKLQNKCQQVVTQNNDLTAQINEAKSEVERLSRTEAEHDSILELATLDREMAEERAEQAEGELEALRSRLEEQELELEILREETENLTNDMSDDQKEAAGYYRLESERDRLRNALLRLKEITDESEAEHKHRIQELEADLAGLEGLSTEKSRLEEQVTTLSATIEDMRQQLDAAISGEELIEELGDQNQQLKDQLAERELVIRDLENLRELNDELELHHIEQENELREELEAREVELAEQVQRITEQDAAIADQDTLVAKFRDLVMDLQSKMSDAESSKTMSEEQAKDVTGRFNEVMELNRRLHTANLNSTVKTITSELQKLQAEEAGEELSIVKHYLPESPDFYKTDSLRAYFRAKRITFKSALTGSLLRAATRPTTTSEPKEESLVELHRLEAVYQLALLNVRSARFWPAMSSASPGQFVVFARASEDLEPIEKTLEHCLEGLKTDELRYPDVTDSLRRSNDILRGLTADYTEALTARPEDETIFHVSSIKADCELIKSSFSAIKSCLETAGIEDGEWEGGEEFIMKNMSAYVDSCNESIVAAGKVLRTLENLRDDALYPRLEVDDVSQQGQVVSKIAQGVLKFAKDFVKRFVSSETTEPILATEISKHMNLLQTEYLPNDELLRMADLVVQLNNWNDFASVLMNNVEIEHGPAPWVVKAQEVEARKKQATEAEKQLQLLSAEHHATMLQIREREEIIDTKDLEIEHLKAKHREAVGKVEELGSLQAELRQAVSERKTLQAQLKAQQTELQRLKELRALSEQSEEQRSVAPSVEQPEKAPAAQQPMSSASATYVSALTAENQWLRSRERDRFSGGLHNMFWHRSAHGPEHNEEAEVEDLLSMIFSTTPLDAHVETNVPAQGKKGVSRPGLVWLAPGPLLLGSDKPALDLADLEHYAMMDVDVFG